MNDQKGFASLTPDSPRADLDEFRTLVREAFEQAQRSGKSNWDEMTSAVLKNRLLNITEGQFTQDRYGSPSFIHLVRRVPDVLEVVSDTPPFRLRIIRPIAEQKDISATPEGTLPGTDHVPTDLTDVDLHRARIRDDLWRAVIDYSSGNTYVIDPDTGLARPKATSDLMLPEFPTVSPDTVASWRQEFIEGLNQSTESRFSESLRNWADGRGKQSDLPGSIRTTWAEYLKRKVILILLEWFKSQGMRQPEDILYASGDRALPSSGTIDEVVQARHLRDLIIRAVRVMTYAELSRVSLPASVLLRISQNKRNRDHD